MDGETVLVTGAAGFIGYHLCQRLLADGARVVGLDNLSPYYDVKLKQDRLAGLMGQPRFAFERSDLVDRQTILSLFRDHQPRFVVHLAAQAGVRYSLENPQAYVESNVTGFLNILEAARTFPVDHLVYASSSSVYGANTQLPFSTQDRVDHPVSLYAATKKSNELMAHAYSHLFAIPTTGLRFFTVYGPWGRPDMAMFKFTQAILDGRPIDLYNYGKMRRDFTYVADIIEGVVRVMRRPATPDPDWELQGPNPATSAAPYRVYNIGNHEPVELERLVSALEKATGRQAICRLLPMQPGDVHETYADIDDLEKAVGFRPTTSIEEGAERFVDWYRGYFRVT